MPLFRAAAWVLPSLRVMRLWNPKFGYVKLLHSCSASAKKVKIFRSSTPTYNTPASLDKSLASVNQPSYYHAAEPEVCCGSAPRDLRDLQACSTCCSRSSAAVPQEREHRSSRSLPPAYACSCKKGQTETLFSSETTTLRCRLWITMKTQETLAPSVRTRQMLELGWLELQLVAMS